MVVIKPEEKKFVGRTPLYMYLVNEYSKIQKKIHDYVEQAKLVLKSTDQCVREEMQKQGITDKPVLEKLATDQFEAPNTTPAA